MKKSKKKDDVPSHPRHPEWTAPTGRSIVAGAQMRVEGQPGKWVFIAYVEHPTAPYVEARKEGHKAVRCFHPEAVYGVQTTKRQPRG